MACERVDPFVVWYSQASISPTFTDGTPLLCTVESLVQETLRVSDLPPIRCVHAPGNGQLTTLDNRRLWVLQEYSRRVPEPITIPCIVEPWTTTHESDYHRKLSLGGLPGPVQHVAIRSTQQSSQQQGDAAGSTHVWSPSTTAFQDVVLRWSCPELINNKAMLINKVQTLADTWPSGTPGVMGFCTTSWWLLQEEVRAQLQQTLERSGDLTWNQVYLDVRGISQEQLEAAGTSGLFTLQVSTQGQATRTPGSSKGPLGCKPTDLVVISSREVSDAAAWERQDTVHSLGLVVGLAKDSDEGRGGQEVPAQVMLFAHQGSAMHTRMGLGVDPGSGEHKAPEWHMAVLGTAATSTRVWHALQCAMQASSGKSIQPLSVLLPRALNPQHTGMTHGFTHTTSDALATMQRDALQDSHQLNRSQATAVQLVLRAAQSAHQIQPRVQLIQGPPGTGKTKTIVAALVELLHSGHTVLMSAPTNVAVQEVAQRFMTELRRLSTSYGSHIDVQRLPRPSEVVLMVAEDALADDSPLAAISSRARALRISRAFSVTGGIRVLRQRLSQLLSAPEAAYKDYQQQLQKSAVDDPPEPLPNHKWLQQELTQLLGKLHTAAAAVAADLPRALLPEAQARQLQSLAVEAKEQTVAVEAMSSDVSTALWAEVAMVHDSSSVYTRDTAGGEMVQVLVRGLQQVVRMGSGVQPPRSFQGDTPVGVVELLVLQCARIVFSTVSSAGRRLLQAARGVLVEGDTVSKRKPLVHLPEGGFDVCVIDEAGQLPEPETSIILQGYALLPALVLVGDPKQLPATVASQLAAKRQYGRSLLERLGVCGVPLHMLDTQYRMHPEISQHPANVFYGGKLLDGPNVQQPHRSAHVSSLPLFQELGQYRVIDIAQGREEKCALTSSRVNRAEADVVRCLVMLLAQQHHQQAQHGQQLSIGVISPYAAQVTLLTEMLQGLLSKESPAAQLIQLEIKSVDGFQGREMDIIILSTVRNNSGGAVGFLQDERRLNVAVTRGRHAVWILSHVKTLKSDQNWLDLINNASSRCLLVAHRDLKGLEKAVRALDQAAKRQADLLDVSQNIFAQAAWKVEFGTDFQLDMVKSCPEHLRPQVIDRLLLLAQGHRPKGYPKDMAVECSKPRHAAIIHSLKVDRLFVLWSVDVDRADCWQIIKVWRLIPQKDLAATVRRVENALAVYSDDYIKRCSKVHWVGGDVMPVRWEPDPNFTWLLSGKGSAGSGAESAPLEHADVEKSMLLMKFFPLDGPVARLLIKAQDTKWELLFKLNEEETKILNHQGTVFVQGRSGTGKTTVIIALLMQREHPYKQLAAVSEECEDGQPSPVALRQLLVTLSDKLCAAMRANLKLKTDTFEMLNKQQAAGQGSSSQAGGGVSAAAQLKQQLLDQEAVEAMLGGLPAKLSHVTSEHCPLVLPLRKLLFMLDACFPVRFSGASTADDDEDPDALSSDESFVASGASDDDGSDDDDLPTATLRVPSGDKSLKDVTSKGRKSRRSIPVDFHAREVTYEIFDARYWPSMDEQKRRPLGPAALWTEIQSHIKGSCAATECPKGYLPRDQYLALAETRKGQHLSASLRSDIYDLFLTYERHKAQRFEWDIADLTAHCHRQLRLHGFPASAQFHYISIDEVQDLVPAQLGLFKYLCGQPKTGFVFAGDTAQTITKGVGFRFADLRELFYRDFLGGGTSAASSSAHKHDTGAHKATMSGMFQLVENYRTHAGIIRLLHTLVECLTHYFPNTIDTLQPECSHLSGRNPVFVDGEDPLWALLGRDLGSAGLEVGAAGCDFGAEQAVLVRDEDSRRALYLHLGQQADDAARSSKEHQRKLADQLSKHLPPSEVALLLRTDTSGRAETQRSRADRHTRLGQAIARHLLVMTATECKGLEFQVVLVHGFFSSSLLKDGWRVIYSYLKATHPELFTPEELGSSLYTAPDFCPQRHQLLCSELKLLYVLCSRAKHCVLFWEPEPSTAGPVLELWTRLGLVDRMDMGPQVSDLLVRPCNAEEWLARATDLFNSEQYTMAQMCAERGGNDRLAARCEAESLRQRARSSRHPKDQKQLYLQAATKFKSLGADLKLQAANCLVSAGEHLEAATLFESLNMPDQAAQQYLSSTPPRSLKAFDCLLAAGKPHRALALSVKAISRLSGGDKDDSELAHCGLRALQAPHWGSASSTQQASVSANITGHLGTQLEAAIVKLSEQMAGADRKTARTLLLQYVDKLGSVERQRTLLARYDLVDALLALEVREGNWQSAGQLAERLHLQEDALQHYLKACQAAAETPTAKTRAVSTAAAPEPAALRVAVGLIRARAMWGHGSQDGWPLILKRAQDKTVLADVQGLLGTPWSKQCSKVALSTTKVPQAHAAGVQAYLDARVVQLLLQPPADTQLTLTQLLGLQRAATQHLTRSPSAWLLLRAVWQAQLQQCRAISGLAEAQTEEKLKVTGVVTAFDTLLSQWSLLQCEVTAILQVALKLSRTAELTTAADKGLAAALMTYMGCVRVAERPDMVQLSEAKLSWAAGHGDSLVVPLKDMAEAATRLFRGLLDTACTDLVNLLSGLAPAPDSAPTTARGRPVPGRSSQQFWSKTKLKQLHGLRCKLLLALENATRTSQRNPQLVPRQRSELQDLQQRCRVTLFRLAIAPEPQLPQETATPSAAATTAVAKGAAAQTGPSLLSGPRVQEQLQHLATELAKSRKYLPDHKRYLATQLRALPETVKYDDLAKILLLQGSLSSDMLKLVKGSPWARDAWTSLQNCMGWEQLILSICCGVYMTLDFRNASTLVHQERGRSGGRWHQCVTAAQHKSESSIWAAFRACSSMFQMVDPYDIGQNGMPLPVEPGIHPDTYLALCERVVCLASTLHTWLCCCGLPLSWVTSHLALPGPSMQLTIMLMNGGWSSAQFSAVLLNDAPAVCQLLANFVSNNLVLGRFYYKATKQTEQPAERLTAWRLRALVVLGVMAVNLQYAEVYSSLPIPFSHDGATPVGAFLRACQAALGTAVGAPDSVLYVLQDALRMSYTAITLDHLSVLVSRLLQAMGDELVVLDVWPFPPDQRLGMFPGVRRFNPKAQSGAVMPGAHASALEVFSLDALLRPEAAATSASGAAASAGTGSQAAAAAQQGNRPPAAPAPAGPRDEEEFSAPTADAAEQAEAAANELILQQVHKPRVAAGLKQWYSTAARSLRGELSPVSLLRMEAWRAFSERKQWVGPVRAVLMSRPRTAGTVSACAYVDLFLTEVCDVQAAVQKVADQFSAALVTLVTLLRELSSRELDDSDEEAGDMGEHRGSKGRSGGPAAHSGQGATGSPVAAASAVSAREVEQCLSVVEGAKTRWDRVEPLLDPRYDAHAALNLGWLQQEVIVPLRTLLTDASDGVLSQVLRDMAQGRYRQTLQQTGSQSGSRQRKPRR